MLSMQNDDLIVVRTFATEAEADVAASALEAAEIDAMIQADTAGGMRPHIAGPQGGSRCWCVRKTRTKPAKSSSRGCKWIEETRQRPPDTRKPHSPRAHVGGSAKVNVEARQYRRR